MREAAVLTVGDLDEIQKLVREIDNYADAQAVNIQRLIDTLNVFREYLQQQVDKEREHRIEVK